VSDISNQPYHPPQHMHQDAWNDEPALVAPSHTADGTHFCHSRRHHTHQLPFQKKTVRFSKEALQSTCSSQQQNLCAVSVIHMVLPGSLKMFQDRSYMTLWWVGWSLLIQMLITRIFQVIRLVDVMCFRVGKLIVLMSRLISEFVTDWEDEQWKSYSNCGSLFCLLGGLGP